ncbi:MAG: hypothetical protein M3011_12180 [Actinomycetota bacterium]|nr:hypothetical protein [Actinomycetota bacterium]
MQRRIRRLVAVGAVAVAVVVVGIVVSRIGTKAVTPVPLPTCTAAVGPDRATLDLEQASHAATIAAVGKREGMSDHAVTVALATAMQESKLRNLNFGDRDSVGLFQQRPSQGWGTPAQLTNPRYAAKSFYDALAEVPGWATMDVTDAAQHVQRSAGPDAYARWEPQARVLAQVLTGEAAAGFACRFTSPAAIDAAAGPLGAAVNSELGPSSVGTEVAAARGWTVAAWLVAHAPAYRITEVSFAGLRWTPSSGRWEPHGPARNQVRLVRAGVRTGAELSA